MEKSHEWIRELIEGLWPRIGNGQLTFFIRGLARKIWSWRDENNFSDAKRV
jgi:hypothetical protein